MKAVADPVFMDERAPAAKGAQPFSSPPPGCVPSVGVWPNVPFSTYVSWKALNHSTLRKVDLSLAHFRDAVDNPKDSGTDSKRFGTSAHELLLEPERFGESIVPAPVNPKTGKPFGSETKAWDEYAAQYPGKLILTEEETTRLHTIVRLLRSHETMMPLLAAPGMSEVCLVWDDDITGMRCKARIDRLIPSFGRMDLKTTQCAKHTEFRKSVLKYGYATQDAFYEMGLKSLSESGHLTCKDRSVFIAVESESPHGIGVYAIGEDSLGIARSLVREWLCAVKEGIDRKQWPGYPTGVQVIDFPEYVFKQFQNDE